MRLWKSLNGNGTAERPKPSREVRDLLMDFGDIVHTGRSVWLTLIPRKLPTYLRGLDITSEARHWVMVLTRRGRLILRFKRGHTRILRAVRAQA